MCCPHSQDQNYICAITMRLAQATGNVNVAISGSNRRFYRYSLACFPLPWTQGLNLPSSFFSCRVEKISHSFQNPDAVEVTKSPNIVSCNHRYPSLYYTLARASRNTVPCVAPRTFAQPAQPRRPWATSTAQAPSHPPPIFFEPRMDRRPPRFHLHAANEHRRCRYATLL